jgi:predicted  nucleic acid-binding Zn-ribbon protein
MRKPRELLRFLAERNPVDWGDCEEIYNRCKSALVDLRRRALAIQERVNSLYAEIQGIREEIRSTERAMSQHFRSIVEWTAEAMATRADFAARLQRLNQRRRQVLAEVAELKRQRLELERGDDAAPHRAELARIELAANLERLRLVRNAILTRSSLTHTQHRPTAWWIPMVDPSGAWFNRIAATTEVYLQPLVSQGSAYNNL